MRSRPHVASTGIAKVPCSNYCQTEEQSQRYRRALPKEMQRNESSCPRPPTSVPHLALGKWQCRRQEAPSGSRPCSTMPPQASRGCSTQRAHLQCTWIISRVTAICYVYDFRRCDALCPYASLCVSISGYRDTLAFTSNIVFTDACDAYIGTRHSPVRVASPGRGRQEDCSGMQVSTASTRCGW